MMKVFRAQFLGESKAGSSCKIENEKDIVLYYDASNNTLNASSRNPSRIQNKYLDHYANFHPEDFKIEYKYNRIDFLKDVIDKTPFLKTTVSFTKDIKGLVPIYLEAGLPE